MPTCGIEAADWLRSFSLKLSLRLLTGWTAQRKLMLCPSDPGLGYEEVWSGRKVCQSGV